MSGGAVIIIDPQRVLSNKSRKETIDILRDALAELESGALKFRERDISATVTDEDDED